MDGSGSRSLMNWSTVIGRLDWGYRIHFQDGSLMMSLSGGLSVSCVGISIKLLSVLMTWLVASPRVRNLIRGRGRTPFMICPQKSHAVTSAALHPSWQSSLMICGRAYTLTNAQMVGLSHFGG